VRQCVLSNSNSWLLNRNVHLSKSQQTPVSFVFRCLVHVRFKYLWFVDVHKNEDIVVPSLVWNKWKETDPWLTIIKSVLIKLYPSLSLSLLWSSNHTILSQITQGIAVHLLIVHICTHDATCVIIVLLHNTTTNLQRMKHTHSKLWIILENDVTILTCPWSRRE